MPPLRLLGVLLLGLAGCAAAPGRDAPPNLLVNASFEQGREPWYDFQSPDKPFWGSFEISDAHAFDGHRSLGLHLDSADFDTSVGIAGAAQDVAVGALPSRLSGRYRVDRWERGAPAQYIQVVLMVFGAENFQELRGSAQLALVLAGIDTPPFAIRNRVFAFAGPVEPESERWIAFDFDLHESFQRHWGKVPVGFGKVRLFLEARFDGRGGGGAPRARAEVHFDALYLGD